MSASLEMDWRERAFLTVPEAARVCNLGRTTAYSAAKNGELPAVRFCGRILVPVGKLRALIGEISETTGAER